MDIIEDPKNATFRILGQVEIEEPDDLNSLTSCRLVKSTTHLQFVEKLYSLKIYVKFKANSKSTNRTFETLKLVNCKYKIGVTLAY